MKMDSIHTIMVLAVAVCLSVATACGPDQMTKRATRACEHRAELAKTTGSVDGSAANTPDCVLMLKAMRETVSATAWDNIVGCIDKSTTHAATTACIATPTTDTPDRK